MVRSNTLARVALLALLGIPAAGCAVAGGIFKAGVGVGAFAVIVVVVLVVFVIAKMKG
jgi:hypothetical protein